MRAEITNTSRANQGVHTDDGLEFIAPGKTRILTIADSYVERAQSLPFLTVIPLDPASEQDADDEAELIDAMTDEELRAFILKRTGKAAHPNAKTDTLIAKAKEAVA